MKKDKVERKRLEKIWNDTQWWGKRQNKRFPFDEARYSFIYQALMDLILSADLNNETTEAFCRWIDDTAHMYDVYKNQAKNVSNGFTPDEKLYRAVRGADLLMLDFSRGAFEYHYSFDIEDEPIYPNDQIEGLTYDKRLFNSEEMTKINEVQNIMREKRLIMSRRILGYDVNSLQDCIDLENNLKEENILADKMSSHKEDIQKKDESLQPQRLI